MYDFLFYQQTQLYFLIPLLTLLSALQTAAAYISFIQK